MWYLNKPIHIRALWEIYILILNEIYGNEQAWFSSPTARRGPPCAMDDNLYSLNLVFSIVKMLKNIYFYYFLINAILSMFLGLTLLPNLH